MCFWTSRAAWGLRQEGPSTAAVGMSEIVLPIVVVLVAGFSPMEPYPTPVRPGEECQRACRTGERGGSPEGEGRKKRKKERKRVDIPTSEGLEMVPLTDEPMPLSDTWRCCLRARRGDGRDERRARSARSGGPGWSRPMLSEIVHTSEMLSTGRMSSSRR